MGATVAPPLAPDLEAALRRLKLAAVRRLAPELLVTAKTQRLAARRAPPSSGRSSRPSSPHGTPRMPGRACGRRGSRSTRRSRGSPSPRARSPRATFDYIGSLEWIRAKESLVLVGPAGTGKSHLLVAAGLAAVEREFRVRYFAAAALAETLYRGLADNSVGRLIESLLRADLVIVDDLGFAPLDDTGAQLLFRLVAAAYESAGVSASPRTGRSRAGAASCPSTRPRSRSSIGSFTTASSS